MNIELELSAKDVDTVLVALAVAAEEAATQAAYDAEDDPELAKDTQSAADRYSALRDEIKSQKENAAEAAAYPLSAQEMDQIMDDTIKSQGYWAE